MAAGVVSYMFLFGGSILCLRTRTHSKTVEAEKNSPRTIVSKNKGEQGGGQEEDVRLTKPAQNTTPK